MKEILTLLERCQREARETVSENIYDTEMSVIPEDCIPDRLLPVIDTLIANTLKQAAEEFVGVIDDYEKSMAKLHSKMIGNAHEDSKMMLVFDLHSRRIAIKHIKEKITALTDAQKVLLGEDNETV